MSLVKKLCLVAAAALAMPAYLSAQTVLFEADFETDQSANFNIIGFDAGGNDDWALDFEFDYIAAGIPLAPNSEPGDTNGLQMLANSNDATAAAAYVNAFLDVSGLGEYVLQFDLFHHPLAASGTTEFAYWGAGDGVLPIAPGQTDYNGFAFGATGEGGASSDYVYYEGAGTGTAGYFPDFPRWWDTATPPNMNNTDQDWLDFFDEDTGTETLGSPDQIWVTIQMEVLEDASAPSGYVVNVYMTAPGKARELVTAPDLEVGAEAGALDLSTPMIGYGDVFSSISDTNNFGVFDNVIVFDELPADPGPPSNVNNWQLWDF